MQYCMYACMITVVISRWNHRRNNFSMFYIYVLLLHLALFVLHSYVCDILSA